MSNAADRLVELYPRIFFACHTRRVPDPKTRRVLSSHRASILDHLDEVEPTPVMQLAMHMGVTASTMSISLDRLERQGYVRRTRDKDDARRVGIRLTRAGVRIKEAQSLLDPERVEAMLAHLSPAEQASAIEGLALLARAALQEMHNKSLIGLRRGPRSGSRVMEDRTHAEGSADATEKANVDLGLHRRRRARRPAGHGGGDRTDAAPRA